MKRDLVPGVRPEWLDAGTILFLRYTDQRADVFCVDTATLSVTQMAQLRAGRGTGRSAEIRPRPPPSTARTSYVEGQSHMRMTTHVDGPAPAELAWERYADPDRWSTWAPQIRSVETDQEGHTRIHSGLTGTVRALFGIDVRFTITDVDEATRSWAWTVHPPAFTLHLEHTVERRPTGSRTGLVVRGPAPVVLAYLPVARHALRRLVGR